MNELVEIVEEEDEARCTVYLIPVAWWFGLTGPEILASAQTVLKGD